MTSMLEGRRDLGTLERVAAAVRGGESTRSG